MAIEQWQTLLDRINIVDRKKRFYYDEGNLETELLTFETQTGITLPLEYKEFLQVFGPGEFGRGIFHVYRPNSEFSKKSISFHIDAARNGFLKNDLILVMGFDYVTPEESENAMDLLKSVFDFGGSSRRESLFWDLRTYSELDRSYDIYLARLEHVPVKIGRSFYGFVRDICFGLNPQTTFPIQLQPYLDEISLTFHRCD